MAVSMSLGAAILVLIAAASAIPCSGARDRLAAAKENARRHYGGEGESDLVTGLPGQPPAARFRHYAGNIQLGGAGNKALFYWFFEAEGGAEAAAKKPLLLWLNGGPGCSSVAYGAAQELGPFLVRGGGNDGEILTLNPYSWNKAANLLFLEAPAGVGFSYTNRSEDLWETGDRSTAADSHDFLLRWFDRFPSFKSNDFYIAGESYAGHYVPQLAELIHDANKEAAGTDAFINFKGIMIGNALLNGDTDGKGSVEYAWSHAIISDELYSAIRRHCSFFKPTAAAGQHSGETEDGADKSDAACSLELEAYIDAYSNIDIYNIYTPVCISSLAAVDTNISTSSSPRLRRLSKLVGAAPHRLSQHDVWHEMAARTSSPPLAASSSGGYDPCTGNYVEAYFNREDVQKALHANLTRLSYPYSSCSQVFQNWTDSPDTVLPTLRKLMDAGHRVWVYSGDTDGRIPVTSTRYSINEMGLTAAAAWGGWREWYDGEQVAGWAVEYEEGLTLVTVRGAGHMVPVFAPESSLSLVTHFLSGEKLPPSRSSSGSHGN